MRIVGGTLRGRAIEAPQGRGTRPTTDRMRESIASMVLSAQGLDIDGCHVLDAFAGSGAVGLELLSRGASHCCLCERDRRVADLVRRNCKALGISGSSWDVVVGDTCRLVQRPLPGAPFDVVFLDPPYAMAATDVDGVVGTLLETDQLARDCLIVYERATSAPCLEPAGVRHMRTRKHGGTSIDLMRVCGHDGDGALANASEASLASMAQGAE